MPLSRSLVALLNRFQPSAAAVLLFLATLVGISTGVGVLLFRSLIDLAQYIYWRELLVTFTAINPALIVLIPILGGLIVSLLRLKLQETEAGLSNISKAVAKEGGRLPYAQIPLKTAAAALSLGAGASLGPEGPSVELGSNIGSLFGQMLKFSSDRTRLLVAAGASAGLSAGFNAPIAGVFFALEVLFEQSPVETNQTSLNSSISVVVIAAVVSNLVAMIGLGGEPAFHLPAYEVRSYWELPLYLGLGLLAAGVAIAYNRSLKLATNFFAGEVAGFGVMAKLSMPVKLLIGGLCIGLVALVLPEAIGIGYETVESVLQDSHFAVSLLLILLITKLVLTAISIGSGFVGGIFAPAIFLGALLGSAYGQSLSLILPPSIAIAEPPAYALVGMAAVLGGSIRAPLTAVLLLFEMTRDYRIVLPLMAAAGLCTWLVDQLQPRSLPVASGGAKQPSRTKDIPEDNLLSKIKVAEVMSLHPLMFNYTTPLLQVAEVVASQYFHSAIVVDDADLLIGILTSQDIERALSAPDANTRMYKLTVADICTKDIVQTYADESLTDALRHMAARDLRQLPVVDRDRTSRAVGMLERQAITIAYTTALTKRAIADKIATNKLELANIIEPEALEPVTSNPILQEDRSLVLHHDQNETTAN